MRRLTSWLILLSLALPLTAQARPNKRPGDRPTGHTANGERPRGTRMGGSPIPAMRAPGRPRADARADLIGPPPGGARPPAVHPGKNDPAIAKIRTENKARVDAKLRAARSPKVRFKEREELPDGTIVTRTSEPGGPAPYKPGSRTSALRKTIAKRGLHRGSRGAKLRTDGDEVIEAAALRAKLSEGR